MKRKERQKTWSHACAKEKDRTGVMMVMACLSDPQKGKRWSVVLIKPRTFLMAVALLPPRPLQVRVAA